MPTTADNFDFRKSLRIKILLVLFSILIIVLMFPKGEALDFEVTVGSVWLQEDLIASFPFPLLKDKEIYENEKELATSKIHKIFQKDTSLSSSTKDSLRSFLLNIKSKIQSGYSEKLPFNEEVNNTIITLILDETSSTKNFDRTYLEFLNAGTNVLNLIYQKGLVDDRYLEIKDSLFDIREGKYQVTFSINEFFTSKSVKKFIKESLNSSFSEEYILNNTLEVVVLKFLLPNIKFNRPLTEKALDEAKNKISRNIGIVQQDERIVAKHDRITPEIKRKIVSYREAKSQEMGFIGKLLQNFGKFLHICMIFTLLSIYIFLFRKGIFYDNLKILLILIVFMLVFVSVYIIQNLNVKAPIEFLVLVPVASMLLTIMFDSRIGFYSTVVVALISGALRGNDYVFATTNIIAGALSAYTVRDIKNRTQIFRSFAFILLGYLIGILTFGFERFDTFNNMLEMSFYAIINALVSPILTFGLIIFFERSFGITTELTYLELTNFNHPLLRELAKTAPGTFNHSMTIGVLVENAAEVIGANQIIARVGAYFHDIGKTVEPDSFVENQMTSDNIHEQIKPERSAELILNHVNYGIELAKKYKLPEEVIDFIPMHHGTMIISYFYEKAKELYGEGNVKQDYYRYSGPKPNTKETALLMLADACESAVRSLEEVDPQKVENMVNNLIQKRIDDGQLDEAPLTFSDIKKIKQSFVSSLLSQHHKRIRYPKQDELEAKSNL